MNFVVPIVLAIASGTLPGEAVFLRGMRRLESGVMRTRLCIIWKSRRPIPFWRLTRRFVLRDRAGAKGLMQLMPRTVKWLGDTDRAVSRNTSQRLDEPRHSLRMGAVYFKRMLDRSDGNIAFALGSYNAGPGNFDKWRRRNPDMPLAESIEKIPFSETRNYVKRILAHYATYKSIYP